MRLSQDQTRVTLLTSCFCHPGELYFLATSHPSAMSAFGTVFKFMDPSRYSVRPGVYYIYTLWTCSVLNGNTYLGKLFKKTGVFFKQALIQVMEKKKNPGGQIIMNCT